MGRKANKGIKVIFRLGLAESFDGRMAELVYAHA